MIGEQPAFFNLLDYFLSARRLDEIGSRTAVEFRGRAFSYHQLRKEVDYWVARFERLGIAGGDRVAMLLFDSPEFIGGFLACSALGAICVPINTYLTSDEIQFIIRDSGARLTIAESELLPKLDAEVLALDDFSLVVIDTDARPSLDKRKKVEAPTAIRATDLMTPAFILYTSGSTGTPKGALHLHKNVLHTVESFGKNVLKLKPDDKVFSASKLFFAYGLGNSLSFPLSVGATVILETERPTPDRLAKIFSDQRPTVFYAVPSVYQALLSYQKGGASLDTSSLRLCISAGEALPATVFEEWRRVFGLTILDGIGSTEMLHMFISNREGSARAGSSGNVVEGYDAKLVDDADNEIVGEGTGNLLIKGESAMAGYWKRDDLTASVVRNGWVRTGDVYRRGEEGYYYHIGRSDDCFKVKGLWVSPVEVESALLGHEAVSEAAVVAGADEIGLATVRAYVVIRKGSERETLAQELTEFARSKLPPYKAPTEIEFIREMPRTSTGKIQRFKLRQ